MKKLTRSRDDKWIAGVCGGIADYTGVDVTVIRLIVAIGTIFSAGTGLLAYAVAWILMPQPAEQVTVWTPPPAAPTTSNEPRPPSE